MKALLNITSLSLAVAAASDEEAWADQSKANESVRPLAAQDLQSFTSVKEYYDLEIDYRPPGHIPMEDNLSLELNDPESDPLRLGINFHEATWEVIGWGLAIPFQQNAELPLHIGRRFLDLYSKSIGGNLSAAEANCLDVASRQVDYRSYLAARSCALPRYREATLVRRKPVLMLQFLDTTNVKLDTTLAAALRPIHDGARFGAWYTTSPSGTILGIQSPVLLPSPRESWEKAKDIVPSKPIEFPSSLMSLLPKAADTH